MKQFRSLLDQEHRRFILRLQLHQSPSHRRAPLRHDASVLLNGLTYRQLWLLCLLPGNRVYEVMHEVPSRSQDMLAPRRVAAEFGFLKADAVHGAAIMDEDLRIDLLVARAIENFILKFRNTWQPLFPPSLPLRRRLEYPL